MILNLFIFYNENVTWKPDEKKIVSSLSLCIENDYVARSLLGILHI